MKIPEIFVPDKDLEVATEKLLKEHKKDAEPKYDNLGIITANSYAEGIAKLKEQGKKPFTFVDNVGARIDDYKYYGKDAELFWVYSDSVTGIAYKANSTKFKIVLRSDKLENIKPDVNQDFIPIDYDAEQGVELDNKKGKYNKPLTRKEVKNHKFWLAVMNGDKEKLEKYADIWFDKTKAKEGMGIHLIDIPPKEGEMLALVLCSNSDVLCYSRLDSIVRFLGAK